jgi:hypothetical protein
LNPFNVTLFVQPVTNSGMPGAQLALPADTKDPSNSNKESTAAVRSE